MVQKIGKDMEAVVEMEKRMDAARVAFEPYKYYPSEDDTREDLKEKLDDAQGSYNSAVKRLEYETTLEEALSRRSEALKDYQKLLQGPDPDAVEAADARLAAANANLDAAQAARENLDLVATIDGTVVKQDLVTGQQVTAGQPVMTVADFSQMFAETDDLTEIEVVDVSEEQKTTVEADAIPGLELTGTVDSINDIYEEKRGDVTYTARILLDEVDPRLRWGMTVLITFKK